MSSAILEVKALSKQFDQAGTPIEVLRNLQFTVNAGESVAILGQSGSGKSTLLSLLAGLDRPSSGSIQLNGRPLQNQTEDELAQLRARDIGFIFQQFHLMSNLTSLENAALPLELRRDPEAQTRAEEMLKKVGLGHRLRHFPAQLSGGERQRVAIARALVTRPALLLADEPSGNLDPKTGTHVMGALFDLVTAEKATLLLVTHNEELAARCHRRLHLADGALREG